MKILCRLECVPNYAASVQRLLKIYADFILHCQGNCHWNFVLVFWGRKREKKGGGGGAVPFPHQHN